MDASRKSSCRDDAASCQSMNECSYCAQQFVEKSKSPSASADFCKDYAMSPSNVSARQKPCAQSAPRRKIPYEPPTPSVTSCNSFKTCDKCRKLGEVENSARFDSGSSKLLVA